MTCTVADFWGLSETPRSPFKPLSKELLDLSINTRGRLIDVKIIHVTSCTWQNHFVLDKQPCCFIV